MVAVSSNKLLLKHVLKVWSFTFLVSPILMYSLLIIYHDMDADGDFQFAAFWIGTLTIISIIISLPLFVIMYFVSRRLVSQQFTESKIKWYLIKIVLIYFVLLLLLSYFFGGLDDDREFVLLSGYFLIPFVLVLPCGIYFIRIRM